MVQQMASQPGEDERCATFSLYGRCRAGRGCLRWLTTNQCRVDGSTGSFWTACGQHALATAMGGTWTSPFSVQTRDHPEEWMAERACDRQTRAVLWRAVPCAVRGHFFSLLVFAIDRAGRFGPGRARFRLARVAHLPGRAGGVVGDEERPVLGDGDRGGPSPHLGAPFARSPEAGHEILVVARRLPVLERHAHHLVAGRLRAVPRPFEGHEGAALHLGRKLLGIVEHEG